MNDATKNFLKQFGFLVWAVRRARRVKQRYERWREQQPWAYEPLIARYLAEHTERKLHIGAGPHHLAGWLNTDFYPTSRGMAFLDATKPFPLPGNAFDCAFSEHMIEHITFDDGQHMLREIFRVLKPGGKVRIATPNLQSLVELFTPQKTEAQRRYVDYTINQYFPHVKVHNECFVLNNFMRNWDHQFVYDPPTLQVALERVGFKDVQQHPIGESPDGRLRGLESHGKQIGDEWNRFETMALEARKPDAHG
ncbi:MAG: methyltransferase domain-containing protein [Verrucomicrobiota bacterium]